MALPPVAACANTYISIQVSDNTQTHTKQRFLATGTALVRIARLPPSDRGRAPPRHCGVAVGAPSRRVAVALRERAFVSMLGPPSNITPPSSSPILLLVVLLHLPLGHASSLRNAFKLQLATPGSGGAGTRTMGISPDQHAENPQIPVETMLYVPRTASPSEEENHGRPAASHMNTTLLSPPLAF